MEKDDVTPLPVRRVVLTGAESTGKTTLAARLAAAYDTVWVPEYLRRFVAEKGALPGPADMDAVARGHMAAEDALRPQAHRVLFLDTDLLSSCVYNRYYFGHCPAWIVEASRARHADLYLLAGTDIPWAPDPGQRDGPAVRAELQRRFEAELVARGVPFVHLTGTVDARLRRAMQAVDALLTPA